MKSTFYLATKNINKVKEVRAIIKGTGINVLSCPENIEFPEETGKTFRENAFIKAQHLKKFLPDEYVAGEDSGLIAEKLGDAPGVYSARFAGEKGNDGKNIKKLLRLLSDCGSRQERKAKFVTVVCLLAEEEKRFFRGEVEGVITFSPRGSGGFGYDPVFEIPSLGKTFAQITAEEKNKLSHRAAAFRKLSGYLINRIKKG
jgi:XTP/dITP diphosphohydrolase